MIKDLNIKEKNTITSETLKEILYMLLLDKIKNEPEKAHKENTDENSGIL